MRKIAGIIALACVLVGCLPKTVISPMYDFSQVKRIGIMSFSSPWRSMQGVENLFAKYLLESGFKVVERAQLESILGEHHISVSGYLSPQTTRAIGQILGVDVLLVGEVSSYKPAHTGLTMTEQRQLKTRPVYQQEVVRQADGTYAGHLRHVGTEVSRSAEVLPTTYTIDGHIGLIAKMVDVETAEIVWIGSAEDTSSNPMEAAELLARKLVKSFRKELAKQQQTK